MTEKYYTPNIEEFRIGLDYEWKSIAAFWVKETINSREELIEVLENTGDKYRVKYLDREDIESLNWKFHTSESIHNSQTFRKESPLPGYNKQLFYMELESVRNENNFVPIYIKLSEINLNHPEYEEIRFSGNIKNKSELRTLMKQLNIQ